MQVPENLNWLRQFDGGSDWLDRLPDTVAFMRRAWGLVIDGPAYSGGWVSFVLPVRRSDEPCVLKLQWPSRESAYEADALIAWAGKGAVELLDHDREHHALLLEKCAPGRFLFEDKETDQIGVVIDLLPRLWITPERPFPTIEAEVKHWAQTMPKAWEAAGQPCEWRLVKAALEYADILVPGQTQRVLINQDLHGANILSAQREPWLVIDPKPLVAERELGLAPVIRSAEFGHCEAAVIDRLDRLTDALNLDRERAIGWTVLQTIAWSFAGQFDESYAELTRWLLAARGHR